MLFNVLYLQEAQNALHPNTVVQPTGFSGGRFCLIAVLEGGQSSSKPLLVHYLKVCPFIGGN